MRPYEPGPEHADPGQLTIHGGRSPNEATDGAQRAVHASRRWGGIPITEVPLGVPDAAPWARRFAKGTLVATFVKHLRWAMCDVGLVGPLRSLRYLSNSELTHRASSSSPRRPEWAAPGPRGGIHPRLPAANRFEGLTRAARSRR